MEEIIYSQMCLMKENMKMLQDRLLKEMVNQYLVWVFQMEWSVMLFMCLNEKFFHRSFFLDWNHWGSFSALKWEQIYSRK